MDGDRKLVRLARVAHFEERLEREIFERKAFVLKFLTSARL